MVNLNSPYSSTKSKNPSRPSPPPNPSLLLLPPSILFHHYHQIAAKLPTITLMTMAKLTTTKRNPSPPFNAKHQPPSITFSICFDQIMLICSEQTKILGGKSWVGSVCLFTSSHLSCSLPFVIRLHLQCLFFFFQTRSWVYGRGRRSG